MIRNKECFIDCGLNGAIVVVEDDTLTNVIRMPKKGKLIDIQRLNGILAGSTHIAIEQQFNPSSKPNKGAFTNAENFGGIKWISLLVTENVEVVDAKKWKGFHNLMNTPNRSPLLKKIVKTDSIVMANKLFDLDIDVLPSLDGLGDAILIMNYSRRVRNKTLINFRSPTIITKQ